MWGLLWLAPIILSFGDGGSYLDFYDMYRVPASLDSLCVSSLLDENYTSKTMVQVPQVYRTNTTFKVSERREGRIEGKGEMEREEEEERGKGERGGVSGDIESRRYTQLRYDLDPTYFPKSSITGIPVLKCNTSLALHPSSTHASHTHTY